MGNRDKDKIVYDSESHTMPSFDDRTKWKFDTKTLVAIIVITASVVMLYLDLKGNNTVALSVAKQALERVEAVQAQINKMDGKLDTLLKK